MGGGGTPWGLGLCPIQKKKNTFCQNPKNQLAKSISAKRSSIPPIPKTSSY
jgi:hypothetical protein